MAAHVLMLAALAATAPPDDRAIGSSVSYVFATELGSGIYELSGRTLQVYRIPLSRELKPPREGAPGVRVITPLTVGFFDFEPRDVLSSGIPTRVDSFSITPGLELEYELSARWRVVPYLRFGASFASSSVDGMLYGLGVRSDYDRPRRRVGASPAQRACACGRRLPRRRAGMTCSRAYATRRRSAVARAFAGAIGSSSSAGTAFWT
ncbi:MAG: hypothetical protein ACRETX_09130 [Steroidobacteraceae bacterium]